MKRLYIIIFLAVLASCQKDNVVPAVEEAVVEYSVQPSVQFEVKSSGGESETAESTVNVLWYGVYHKKADGRYVYMNDMSAFVEVTNPSDIQVPIVLIKDQEYKLVFVAQHRVPADGGEHEYVYTVSEEGVMSLNADADVTLGEQLEAFVFVDELGPVTGNENRRIKLDRVVSQVNIGTTSTVGGPLGVSVSGAAKSYDIFRNEYSEETSQVEFNALGNLAASGNKITVSGTEYNLLTRMYFLGNNKLDFTISDSNGSIAISSIDTKVNFKTNVVGEIL